MTFSRRIPQTLALIAAGFLTSAANAQQGNQLREYPWRVNSATNRSTEAVPLPPGMNNKGESVRIIQASSLLGATQEQEPVARPDAAGFGVKVPTPPNGDVYQSVTEQKPPLSVSSNARDEDEAAYCYEYRPQCCVGDARHIFPQRSNGLQIGGFSQFGYHNRDTVTFNNRRGNVALHQLWMYADGSANAAAGRNWGYRVDGVYGIDAQDIQAIGNPPTGAPTGWDNSWDFGSYGWALPQAYVEYDNSLTNIKLGKFLSPIGFEAVPSVENFFYSRTYARYYTEPFSHTGILATREVRPGVTAIGGASLGWNTGFDQTDNGFNLITGVRLNPSDRVALGLTGSVGDMGYRGSGVLQTATAQVRLTDRLTWGMQGDYLNLQTNDELGLTNYLFLCQSDCLSFGTRLEWWKSDQLFTSSRSTWDWTVGANWKPHSNVVIRPEVRMDWGAATDNDYEPIIGIDAIILF